MRSTCCAASGPARPALYHQSETTPLAGLAWPDLANGVRVLATRLRAMGVRPGDRVASCMPNIPQTVIAMLATTSIGAIWTSCSPDFGWRGVSDRFGQLAPKVLFCVDSYRYGGRDYDRSAEVEQIIALLPGLEQVIHVPGPAGQAIGGEPRAQAWDEVMDHPPVPAAEFEFEQVPFGHPLWILFSSGTTGLPKAITHSHGGILIEQLKLQTFHMDLRPGDRMFFHTTTGWMMWNFLVSSLLLGVRPLLYDGNPGYPGPGVLWEMAQNAGVTLFGASPAYVDMLSKAGLVPGGEVRPVRAGRHHAGRLAGVGGVRRLVLPQRQAGPVAVHGQRRNRHLQRVRRRDAHAARLRRRDPGPPPGRLRVRVQRRRASPSPARSARW